MASPQCEDGYCKIANELLDALCCSCPGGAMGQVLIAVIRKTYGWNKKCDSISISQLTEATRLCRRSVIYAIKNLEAKRMIVVKRHKVDERNDINLISIQKDYSRWVVQEMDTNYKQTIEKQKVRYRNRVVQEIDGSARNGKKVVQEIDENEPFLAPTKDNIQKTKKHSSSTNGFEDFYAEYPRKVGKQSALNAWNKINPDKELKTTILANLRNQKANNHQWTKDNGQFIPHPATWLNGRRWEDECSRNGNQLTQPSMYQTKTASPEEAARYEVMYGKEVN